MRSVHATQEIIMLTAQDSIHTIVQKVQQVQLALLSAKPLDLSGVMQHLQAIYQIVHLTINPLYSSKVWLWADHH